MEWLFVTLALYRRVFSRAATLAVKNWPVMGSVFVYTAVMSIATYLAMALGMLGGFVLSLVWAACVGSFLYLVEMMVRTNRVTLEDFRRSFGMYLWDVVGVTFIAWLFFTFATPAIAQMPQGFVILLCIKLAIVVLFNAVPELIYLGHHSSVQLLSESYAFVAANWIEWFPANLLAGFVLYAVDSLAIGGLGVYAQLGLLSLVVYFTMVMRGLLFIELHGSSRRGRAFKYRMKG